MELLGEMRIADYVLAVEGLAMARNVLTSPKDLEARAAEVSLVVGAADSELLATRIPITEYDVSDGYTRWAPRYDGPNPLVEAEAPIVAEIIDGLAPGRALDAACGTGRHSALLASRGWEVVGVDATEAMLDVARAKVPAGSFHHGRLEALPLEDSSVDLVVCALALTHVADLRPVYAEFARVVRPGGVVLTTDIHPIFTLIGVMAGFPVEDRDADRGGPPRSIHHVRNLTHHHSSYVDALRRAGLTITTCLEPRFGEESLAMMPTHAQLPDATRQAFLDLPFLLVWGAESAPGEQAGAAASSKP